MATLTPDQLTQATGVIAQAAADLLAGNNILDPDRIKATRLYGVVLNAQIDTNTITNDDVVRSDVILMLAGGAGFGDVIKYMVDCMTGNPIAAPATLADDDDASLLAGLGGQPDQTQQAHAAPAPAPKPGPVPTPPPSAPQPTAPSAQPAGRSGRARRGGVPQ